MIRRLVTVMLMVWSAGFGLASVQGLIKGTVSDKNGKPIEDVKVTIASMEFTSLNLMVRTDKKGQFIEISVQPGYYQIKMQKNGYLPQLVEMRIGNRQTLEVGFLLEEGQYTVSESSGEQDFKTGNERIANGKFEEAAKSYKEAVAKEPDEPIYYNNLGIAYLNLEKLDEALEVYRNMLEIQPRSYSAHKMIGELYSIKKEYRQALPFFTRATVLSPDDPEAFYNLGLCLMNMGASSQSLDEFKHALELKPNYPMAYYQTGMVYVNQNRKEEAIRNLEKFLELAPTDSRSDVAREIIKYLKTTG